MIKRSLIVLLVVVALLLTACAPADTTPTSPATEAEPSAAQPTDAPDTPDTPDEPGDDDGNPNIADYAFDGDPDVVFDINKWYGDVDVEAAVGIRNPGLAYIPDVPTTPMPKAKEKYTIGFSVYFTVDEVGAMILESMKSSAAEAGVELLVNDANYDQSAQNQAVEQWILQEVDGVILAPCDFTGVKTSLDALEKAGIPVVALNAPLAGNTDVIVTSNTVQQGTIAGELLEKAMLDAGLDMNGTIVYQTLPFVHPNAATRAKGFKDVFADYADINIVELTGIEVEEHYTAFDGALKAYPDMIAAWGLYSSATIGMMNAKEANHRDDILLSSVDQDKPILKGIQDGVVVGSAAYSSIAPAWWCMSAMVNMLNGEAVPGVLFYENKAIDKDNVVDMFEYYYPGKTLQDYVDGKID